LQDEREDVVEQTEEEGGKDRDQNNHEGKGHSLTTSRPRDVSELTLGILDVVDESIHCLGYKKTPSGGLFTVLQSGIKSNPP
jgi:hypothetical protein